MLRRCLNQQQSQLVLTNLGLAYDFAATYKWHPKHIDIIQACILGLCEAALRWDKDGKAAFSTYAYYWMQNCSGIELKDTESITDTTTHGLFRPGDYEEFLVNALYLPNVRKVLLQILCELSENERHAVLLKYPLDTHSRIYTDVDIATMLDCSESWVGVLRKKALCKLKHKLIQVGFESYML